MGKVIWYLCWWEVVRTSGIFEVRATIVKKIALMSEKKDQANKLQCNEDNQTSNQ